MIDRQFRDRYSRQIMFPEIGEVGQAKLRKSTAVVIGCGALGGNIANFLVRAGVGKVKIVDRDFIELHNLQRQVKNQLPKAIAAERHLKKVNSSVEIEGIVADANYTNIERFCSGADVILDGLDNRETRFLINDVALKHKIPWIYGGALASQGMTMTIIPGDAPCFRCVAPVLPEPGIILTCETAGIVGTVPAIVASLQATEAMKILVGSKEINRGIIHIDVWKFSFQQLKLEPRK
ncbi:ThiF family adenylyltransferase, partial [Chloroflexota bacterium]